MLNLTPGDRVRIVDNTSPGHAYAIGDTAAVVDFSKSADLLIQLGAKIAAANPRDVVTLAGDAGGLHQIVALDDVVVIS